MKELKDIILQKGDIVYLDTNVRTEILIDGTKIHQKEITHITKIERPIKIKYKTIYERPKQILDQKEKEYLEAVIRPFRDRVECIEKKVYARDFEYIHIRLYGDDSTLPAFEENKMYKGMELNKEYTLKELGLFKE